MLTILLKHFPYDISHLIYKFLIEKDINQLININLYTPNLIIEKHYNIINSKTASIICYYSIISDINILLSNINNTYLRYIIHLNKHKLNLDNDIINNFKLIKIWCDDISNNNSYEYEKIIKTSINLKILKIKTIINNIDIIINNNN